MIYKGCYKDTGDRDLPIYIGEGLTMEECFNQAQEFSRNKKLNPLGKAVTFVGLQWGKLCFASDLPVGKYGEADERECSMVCVNDPDTKCGGSYRNSVYDIKRYRRARRCSKPPVDCSKRGGYDTEAGDNCQQVCVNDTKTKHCRTRCVVLAFSKGGGSTAECFAACRSLDAACAAKPAKDCTGKGGYDHADICEQTCIEKDDPVDPEQCSGLCKRITNDMEFSSRNAEYSYFASCRQSCAAKVNHMSQETCSKMFVDCSARGGYDPSDECHQTCLMKEEAYEKDKCTNSCKRKVQGLDFGSDGAQLTFWNKCLDDCNEGEISCSAKCTARESTMRFASKTDQLKYKYACRLKCSAEAARAKAANKVCTSDQFVDCSSYGGYDPVDPCKQTCIQPRPGGRESTAGRSYAADTTRDQVDATTTTIISHGEEIAVMCSYGPTGQVLCVDASTGKKIEMNEKASVKDLYSATGGRSPSGRYWKFDCTIFQKFLLDNCWEGDDGQGHDCTLWDRVFSPSKCFDTDDSAIKSPNSYSLLGIAAASIILVELSVQ